MNDREVYDKAFGYLSNTFQDTDEMNAAIARVEVFVRKYRFPESEKFDYMNLIASEDFNVGAMIGGEMGRINGYLAVIGFEEVMINGEPRYKLAVKEDEKPRHQDIILNQREAILLVVACHDVEAKLYIEAGSKFKPGADVSREEIQALSQLQEAIRRSQVVQDNLPAIAVMLKEALAPSRSPGLTDTESDASPAVSPREPIILNERPEPISIIVNERPIADNHKSEVLSSKLTANIIIATTRLEGEIKQLKSLIDKHPNAFYKKGLVEKMKTKEIKYQALSSVLSAATTESAQEAVRQAFDLEGATKGATSRTKVLLNEAIKELGLSSTVKKKI